jgi:DNA-binding transcriptional LysR family regulator
MDIRDLHYFEVICETRHLGLAAQRLFRTQPALSKCISRLEAELETKLFERVGRQLVLTAVGEALWARARMLRAAMEDTTTELRNFASGAVGHVRIGHTASAAAQLLPELIATLRRDYPGITMELVIGLNDELRALLRAGKVDVVMGPLGDGDAEFRTHVVLSDVAVIAACTEHPVFRGKKVRLRDLVAYRWVLPPATVSARTALERIFQRHRLPLPVVEIETGSASLMPRLIAGTELLTYLSRQHLLAPHTRGILREIPVAETAIPRDFGILYRPAGYLSPAMLSLIRVVTEARRPV